MSKDVVLSYRNGFLKAFLDNWQLYKIAGTSKLSSEEAVAIALNASKDFSWNVVNTDNGNVTVSGFRVESIGNTTLSYLNYMEESTARGGDPFTLYPSWYVPLGLDKIYPGFVNGLTVRIWADNGEVSEISPMAFGGAVLPDQKTISEVKNEEPTTLTSVSTAIALLSGVAGILYGHRKVRFSRLKGMCKSHSSRLCGILLCLLISFSLVLTAMPKADAIHDGQDGKSMIYASTYGQLEDEAYAAEEVCNDTEDLFSDAGYSVTNAFGTNTTVQYVLDNASRMEENYDWVALFHFGHGGFDQYYDDDGLLINASDIEDETVLGKHFFVFIWTCFQGNYSDSGMPVAWTQRQDMSDDGYYYPDEGSHCFLSFEGASPSLAGISFKYFAVYGKDIITGFYDYALDHGYSVNDALDLTSLDLFSADYGGPLHSGYETFWAYNPAFPDHNQTWTFGRMCTYGNGEIYLAKEYELTVLAKDQYGNSVNNEEV